jgi:hypothetical protein
LDTRSILGGDWLKTLHLSNNFLLRFLSNKLLGGLRLKLEASEPLRGPASSLTFSEMASFEIDCVLILEGVKKL